MKKASRGTKEGVGAVICLWLTSLSGRSDSARFEYSGLYEEYGR
jgi:hypothetical protein